MARVQFSALLNNIQGSVGGSTFQRNRSGYTLKNKALGVNTNSLKQNNARLYLSALISLWQSFTDTQRNEWALFANFYPTFNKHNKNVMLSGYQLFIKYNLIRMHAGYNPLTVITYGVIVKFSTAINIYRHNELLFGELDVTFDFNVASLLFMSGSPRSVNYPVKVKTYKAIQLATIFENYFYLNPNYANTFGYTPDAGLYLPYKITYFYLNMPVIQEGLFDNVVITPV